MEKQMKYIDFEHLDNDIQEHWLNECHDEFCSYAEELYREEEELYIKDKISLIEETWGFNNVNIQMFSVTIDSEDSVSFSAYLKFQNFIANISSNKDANKLQEILSVARNEDFNKAFDLEIFATKFDFKYPELLAQVNQFAIDNGFGDITRIAENYKKEILEIVKMYKKEVLRDLRYIYNNIYSTENCKYYISEKYVFTKDGEMFLA